MNIKYSDKTINLLGEVLPIIYHSVYISLKQNAVMPNNYKRFMAILFMFLKKIYIIKEYQWAKIC